MKEGVLIGSGKERIAITFPYVLHQAVDEAESGRVNKACSLLRGGCSKVMVFTDRTGGINP